MKDQGSDLATACWNLSLQEAQRGWISDPVPATDEILATVPLTPRFAQSERHGAGSTEKIRLIDDFKFSGINDLLATADTAIPQTLDGLASLISFYHTVVPGVDLRIFSQDFAHAYKNIGIHGARRISRRSF